VKKKKEEIALAPGKGNVGIQHSRKAAAREGGKVHSGEGSQVLNIISREIKSVKNATELPQKKKDSEPSGRGDSKQMLSNLQRKRIC